MAEKNNSLEKALTVLDLFETRKRLTLASATSLTGYSKASLVRILNTMESKGYIYRDRIDSGYYLADKIYILGRNTDLSNQIVNVIGKPISELCRRCGFSVAVSILNGTRSSTILRKDPQTGLFLTPTAGDNISLNCSASGKVLVAFSDNSDELVDKIDYIRMTPKTVADREEFRELIVGVRTEKVAFDMEEITEGLVCVSVPVLDKTGRAICSISVSGYKERMVRDLYRTISQLRDAAGKCEDLMS